MSSLIYEGRRYDPGRFMKFFSFINLIVAMGVLSAWHFTGIFVAEPMSAATESALSANGKPGMFDEPYVYLWGGPLLATFLGWAAYKLEYKTFGRFVVIYPVVLFAASIVWFNYFNGQF